MKARYGLDNPKKAEFLDWLMDPVPSAITSVSEFAASIGVHPGTLRSWKADGKFRRAWEKELARRNVDPGRTQQVIDALHAESLKGNVQAAKLWMEYVSRFAPPPASLENSDDVSDLSDAELEALIAGEAAELLEARRDAS